MVGLGVYLNYIIHLQGDNTVLNTEIWGEISGLPYEISSLGNVKRNPDAPYKHKNKEYVIPYLNNKGYTCINLYQHSKVHKFQIHRLIAIAFIPNPNNLPEINHIDGNPLNNEISNLEWCTHQYNMQHAWDTGLHINKHANASNKRKGSTSPYRGISWSNERQRWCAGVTFNQKRYSMGRFDNEIEAAQAYDIFIKENDLVKEGYKLNFS